MASLASRFRVRRSLKFRFLPWHLIRIPSRRHELIYISEDETNFLGAEIARQKHFCLQPLHHQARNRCWHRYKSQWEETPPLSFEEKEDAVVFLNSNCDAPSGRTRIVQALREQPGIRVDALGLCLNGSSLMRGPEAKYNAFRR